MTSDVQALILDQLREIREELARLKAEQAGTNARLDDIQAMLNGTSVLAYRSARS